MKARVKAWQAVIDPKTDKVHDEFGLRALDAIMYGPVKEIESATEEERDELVKEFKKLHPDFRCNYLEIVTDEKK